MKISFSTIQQAATMIAKATGFCGSAGVALLGLRSTGLGIYGLYKAAREALDPNKNVSRPALTRAVIQTGTGLAMTGLGLWTIQKIFFRTVPAPVTQDPAPAKIPEAPPVPSSDPDTLSAIVTASLGEMPQAPPAPPASETTKPATPRS